MLESHHIMETNPKSVSARINIEFGGGREEEDEDEDEGYEEPGWESRKN